MKDTPHHGIRRRWSLVRWAGGFVTGAAVLAIVFFLVHARLSHSSPRWAEIERAMARRRWSEVEKKLEQWTAAHPHQGEAQLMLANLRLGLGRRESAVGLLGSIPESSPSWEGAQMMLGELAVRERRAAGAEQIFRRVAGRDPRAIAPRQRLIYLLGMQQRTAEARSILWQIYHISNDPRVLVDLVLELLQDRDDVRGLAPELSEFVAKTPQDAFLRRAWGLSLVYQGRPQQALPHLEAAAAGLVDDPWGRFALAECRIMLGQSVAAEEAMGPPLERPEDAAQWWLFRGQIAEALGQHESALAAFEQAVARQPAGREAHFRLAQLLKRLGRTDLARSQLAEANRIADRIKEVRREHQRLRRTGLPSDSGLFERLGGLCRDAGMIAEARAWLLQAIQLDAKRESAQAGLALIERTPDAEPVALPYPRIATSPGDTRRPSTEALATAEASQRALWHASTAGAPPFQDRSDSAGISYNYESGASNRLHIADTMGGGVGLIDFDNDGWMDIYFINGCTIPFDPAAPPHPNVLYRNLGNGTFRDVTATAGVGGRGYGMGCAVGDYDNDGYEDLFVTGLTETILYRNRGDGTFEDATIAAGVTTHAWTTAAGFGDLDRDGDLDLVVITYVDCGLDDRLECRDQSGRRIHCTPARYPAQDDLLYRNNGDGTFTEVSLAAGFRAPDGRGLGLAIADLDDDGKLDIFVANDATPNFLFRNLGGLRFEEVGAKAGVATNGAGRATASMGVVAEDLDGDGRIDLFITNLVNESSTFFRNLGGGLFWDATLAAGLSAPSRPKTGFGTAALDADNDGRLDLFVANGHVDDRPWANSPMAQTALFFWGRDRGRFDVASPAESSYFARRLVGRGVAAGDFDNDGRVDLVVVHRDAAASLLSNGAHGGHWLGLRLRGKHSGKTPVGTRAICTVKGRSIVRWLTSGTGYFSAHDPRLWFGLGSADRVERLEVTWPGGRTQSWTGVSADRILQIVEGCDELRECSPKRIGAHNLSP
jgi:tetratricopeptide (TPR) repeat protein